MPSFLRPLPFLIAFLSCLVMSGQDVWKTPNIWGSDLRYDMTANTFKDGSIYRADYWTILSKKQVRSDRKWLVFTNKADVPYYAEAGGTAIGTFGFSKTLWVYDEKDQYLRVGNETQPLGWVRKQDLILWQTPLRDKDTGIEIKAFVVNTTRASKLLYDKGENKDRFDVFDSPTGGKKTGDRPLYEVLFVFQYSPGVAGTPGRYLVSEYFTLNSASSLTGWVNEDRLKLWATNLCIEPNWNPAALEERRRKKVYAHIFESGRQEGNQRRDAYFSGGVTSNTGSLFHDPRDPAFLPQNAGSRDRLIGSVFRYPVFGGSRTGTSADNCAFLTGASTKLNAKYATILSENASEDHYLMIEQEAEKMERSRLNLNVVFVLEAGLGPRVDWVRTAMKTLVKADTENRLSMGVVVYYNDDAAKPEAIESSYLSKKDLEPRGEGLEEWLAKQSMSARGDLVDTRPAYLALIRAMEMARAGETNVLIHLCGAPDHSETDLNDARSAWREPKDLKAPLAGKGNIHYLGYVLPTTPELAERAFSQLGEATLITLAAAMREKYRLLVAQHSNAEQGTLPQAPKAVMSSEGGQRSIRVEPASTELRARMYQQGMDVGALIGKDVQQCLRSSEKFFKDMRKILDDGSQVGYQADPLSAEASISLIDQLCAGVSGGSEQAKRECINYSFANKVHYFMDASTLYRAAGLQHPIFSYVIFMEQTTLGERIKSLNDMVSDLNQAAPAERRKRIEDHWKGTALSTLGKSDPKLEILEIQERMYGIDKMNIVAPFNSEAVFDGLKLDDLSDPTKFTQERVTKATAHYSEKLNKLRSVQGNKELKYELDGQRGVFYWVPTEYLFD